jgi:hypothetical protein
LSVPSPLRLLFQLSDAVPADTVALNAFGVVGGRKRTFSERLARQRLACALPPRTTATEKRYVRPTLTRIFTERFVVWATRSPLRNTR